MINLKILSLLILLTSCNTSHDYLKNNSDTVLYYFRGKIGYEETYNCSNENVGMDTCHYNIIFNEENDNSLQNKRIHLVYNKYEDFDDAENSSAVVKFGVDRRFIKNNDDIIITADILRNIGFNEANKIFLNASIIILIENDSLNQNKIVLKEVSYINFGFE